MYSLHVFKSKYKECLLEVGEVRESYAKEVSRRKSVGQVGISQTKRECNVLDRGKSRLEGPEARHSENRNKFHAVKSLEGWQVTYGVKWLRFLF